MEEQAKRKTREEEEKNTRGTSNATRLGPSSSPAPLPLAPPLPPAAPTPLLLPTPPPLPPPSRSLLGNWGAATEAHSNKAKHALHDRRGVPLKHHSTCGPPHTCVHTRSSPRPPYDPLSALSSPSLHSPVLPLQPQVPRCAPACSRRAMSMYPSSLAAWAPGLSTPSSGPPGNVKPRPPFHEGRGEAGPARTMCGGSCGGGNGRDNTHTHVFI